jgi:hypothetical protein
MNMNSEQMQVQAVAAQLRQLAASLPPDGELRRLCRIAIHILEDGKLEVLVTVDGGVVQDVETPKPVRVIVHDYDVDDDDEAELKIDEDGHRYIETIWEE